MAVKEVKSENKPRSIVVKSKITPKDTGSPKKLLAMPESVQRLELGRIQGVIHRLGTKKMPTGDEFNFLQGEFQAIPNDESLDIVQSGVLYMPAGIHELLASMVDETALGHEFAFMLCVFRANNPAGYTWGAIHLLEPVATSTFAQIESKIAKAKIATPLIGKAS